MCIISHFCLNVYNICVLCVGICIERNSGRIYKKAVNHVCLWGIGSGVMGFHFPIYKLAFSFFSKLNATCEPG